MTKGQTIKENTTKEKVLLWSTQRLFSVNCSIAINQNTDY